VKEHGFKRLRLERTAGTPSVEKSASNAHVPHEDGADEVHAVTFQTAEALLDYVTARWREHWVTTDVWDEEVLDIFLRRPFFLLVSVDAPVTVRWDRFRARYIH
jgi:dCMP deaminase